MKKTCANPSCGVALIKTDPHDQCFNHRTCGRSHPCMHCSAVSGPEWDSIKKRQAGLAHRRKKEKEAQLSKGGKFLPGTAPPQPSAFEEVSSSPSSPGAPHTQTHSEQFYVIEEVVQPTLVPELAPVVVNQPSPSLLVLNDNNVQMFNNFLSFLQNNNKSTSEPVVQQPKSLNLTTPVVQADAQSLGQTEDLLDKVASATLSMGCARSSTRHVSYEDLDPMFGARPRDPRRVADLLRRPVSIEGQKPVYTGRPAYRDTGIPGHRETGTPADRETGTPADQETGTPADRETGTPEDRYTGTPADRLVVPGNLNLCGVKTEQMTLCLFRMSGTLGTIKGLTGISPPLAEMLTILSLIEI